MQKAVPIKEVVDTMGAGDSLITSFMVAYTDHLKKGITGETAIRESLASCCRICFQSMWNEWCFWIRQKI